MQMIVAIELVSAVFVGISLFSQFADRNEQKSTKALRFCSALIFVWLCIDAAAYTFDGPQYPKVVLWLINFLAYTCGGIVFLAFIRYCRLYITERTELKRWVLLVPTAVTVFNELIIAFSFVTKRIYVFENGTAVAVGGVPEICQLLNIIMLLYLPAVAFTKRKAIGAKAVSLLGLYGIAPIAAILVVLKTGLDLTVALGAVAVVVVATLLQKDESNKHILAMNRELEKSNNKLRQMTEEQEAQLEEITALNTELEEKQTRVEESATEQEAQLEEIERLNERLQQKQQYTDTLYHKLLRVQACGIVAYTVPQYEIVVMNDMAKKIYGLSIEEVMDNKTVIQHISRARYDDEETTRAALKAIRNPGDKYSFSFWLNREDGSEIHVYVNTQLIEMDNGDRLIVSSLLDITKITEMERVTAQATAANTAKTSFLFNMSHDIRTPMNAIIGYTGLLEKNLGNEERTKDYLHKIKDSSEFLLSLINNVLEMARIESGKAVLDEEVLSTDIISGEIKSVYSELMKAKGIRFEQHEDVKTPFVYGDKVKLQEIFLNLVSNAYKYTPSGGSITVDVRELPCEREGRTIIRTTVSDTGIGMSKEYLPNLFEEFSRAHNTTETKIEGTGLGMPIVKKLVDLMEGTITVESELGRGTTFVVDIPHRIARDFDKISAQEVPFDSNSFAGKHILLAEDNDLNAEIAIELLKETGAEVDRARDGIVCFDMLRKSELGYYDLILMDIQMPNLNGYETTEKIRRADFDIPIIAMTANAFDEDKKKALAAGMNGHLAKPIDVAELMKTLAEILG